MMGFEPIAQLSRERILSLIDARGGVRLLEKDFCAHETLRKKSRARTRPLRNSSALCSIPID